MDNKERELVLPGFNKCDIKLSDKAVQEWCDTHKVGDDWIPVFGYYLKKLPIVVLFNPEAEKKVSVQYAGSGKYFDTMEDATLYFNERIKAEKHRKDYLRKYLRKWRHEHPEKAKEYRINGMRRMALRELMEMSEAKG